MTRFFITVVAALCLDMAWGQQDPFAEMQRRMMDMQRQMMQQLQDMSRGGSMRAQMDSSFFFRFDTTFGGDSGHGGFHFFRSSPFGADSTHMRSSMGDFWGFDSFFDDFFNFAWPPDASGDGMQRYRFPADDGNAPADGLLPEERLRMQEKEKGESKPERPAAPAEKPKDKRAKVETIRI